MGDLRGVERKGRQAGQKLLPKTTRHFATEDHGAALSPVLKARVGRSEAPGGQWRFANQRWRAESWWKRHRPAHRAMRRAA
jgi:hypothetical protein